MKEKLVFATNNAHKLEEVSAMLGERIELLSLRDIGCHADIPETGTTLEENALLKARYAGGEGHDSVANMNKLLARLKGVENRRARFRTVIALIRGGQTYEFEGIVEGHITTEPHGDGGFGYDPVFVPEGYDRTFAELGDVKNHISHRARAVQKLVDFLKSGL